MIETVLFFSVPGEISDITVKTEEKRAEITWPDVDGANRYKVSLEVSESALQELRYWEAKSLLEKSSKD